MVRWIRSYLEGRTARLSFDGEDSEPLSVRAGVPQGSPLSPILFLLYITSLYEALSTNPRLLVVGFADNTNLMVFGRTIEGNCRQLEEAWPTCERWARTRGMQFEPAKSELIHFTRTRAPPSLAVRQGDATVRPTESGRFLGVWLDRKLRWRTHLQKIEEKHATQTYALTSIAASAWGCTLARAREVYTKVIRSAIVYGAAAYHTPAPPGSPARGIAAKMTKLQSACLRRVTGAYKATPTRALETETFVPPIDLYLNQRLAAFEARLERSGVAEVIRQACIWVNRRLRRRGPRGRPTVEKPRQGEAVAQWARRWVGEGSAEEATMRDWEARHCRNVAVARTRHPRSLPAPADTTADFGPRALKRHKGLRKHESATLVQIRTGKIGLRASLAERRVPGKPRHSVRVVRGPKPQSILLSTAQNCRGKG